MELFPRAVVLREDNLKGNAKAKGTHAEIAENAQSIHKGNAFSISSGVILQYTSCFMLELLAIWM